MERSRSGAPPRRSRRARGRRFEESAKHALLLLAGRLWPSRAGDPAPLERAERILIVRQDNRLGNLVLLSPFLFALRSLAPRARIAFLSGDRYAEVLDGCPWIDERLVLPKRDLLRHPYRVPVFLRSLSRTPWDAVFEASNPDTHSFTNALLTLATRAPLRAGFAHARSRAALSRPVAPPEREGHYSLVPLLLLSALGCDPPFGPLRLSPVLTGLAADEAARAEPAVVVHPGGRGSKRWPPERFARLIGEIGSVWPGRIEVIGGPVEAPLVSRLTSGGRRAEARVLDGLPALVRALGAARVCICCDAGPMHVAAALDIPVLALFLASHPLRYAPLGSRHETLLLGERSRTLAGGGQFDTPGNRAAGNGPTGEGACAWDTRLHDRIAAMRPVCVAGAPGLDAEAEVRLVLERLEALLDRTAAPAGRDRAATPAAGARPGSAGSER